MVSLSYSCKTKTNHGNLLLRSTSRSQGFQCQERKQDHESDQSADNFMTPTFEEKAGCPPTTLSFDESDRLIGTSKEHQEYFEDLEKMVKASVEADKEKEKVKKREGEILMWR